MNCGYLRQATKPLQPDYPKSSAPKAVRLAPAKRAESRAAKIASRPRPEDAKTLEDGRMGLVRQAAFHEGLRPGGYLACRKLNGISTNPPSQNFLSVLLPSKTVRE